MISQKTLDMRAKSKSKSKSRDQMRQGFDDQSERASK